MYDNEKCIKKPHQSTYARPEHHIPTYRHIWSCSSTVVSTNKITKANVHLKIVNFVWRSKQNSVVSNTNTAQKLIIVVSCPPTRTWRFIACMNRADIANFLFFKVCSFVHCGGRCHTVVNPLSPSLHTSLSSYVTKCMNSFAELHTNTLILIWYKFISAFSLWLFRFSMHIFTVVRHISVLLTLVSFSLRYLTAGGALSNWSKRHGQGRQTLLCWIQLVGRL